MGDFKNLFNISIGLLLGIAQANLFIFVMICSLNHNILFVSRLSGHRQWCLYNGIIDYAVNILHGVIPMQQCRVDAHLHLMQLMFGHKSEQLHMVWPTLTASMPWRCFTCLTKQIVSLLLVLSLLVSPFWFSSLRYILCAFLAWNMSAIVCRYQKLATPSYSTTHPITFVVVLLLGNAMVGNLKTYLSLLKISPIFSTVTKYHSLTLYTLDNNVRESYSPRAMLWRDCSRNTGLRLFLSAILASCERHLMIDRVANLTAIDYSIESLKTLGLDLVAI